MVGWGEGGGVGWGGGGREASIHVGAFEESLPSSE